MVILTNKRGFSVPIVILVFLSFILIGLAVLIPYYSLKNIKDTFVGPGLVESINSFERYISISKSINGFVGNSDRDYLLVFNLKKSFFQQSLEGKFYNPEDVPKDMNERDYLAVKYNVNSNQFSYQGVAGMKFQRPVFEGIFSWLWFVGARKAYSPTIVIDYSPKRKN